MQDQQTTIDLTHAKNALFVRQSVAVAFGIPIDRELTWDFLDARICNAPSSQLPRCIEIRGLPSISVALEYEACMLKRLLKGLAATYDIEVLIALHD